MKVGDTVVIRTALNNIVVHRGNIARISKTGKKVVVTLKNGCTADFYRDNRKHGIEGLYVHSPGAGTFGHMLNNRFFEHEVKPNA